MEEIIKNQPTINVGMIGSVSNGKSSITEKLTGIKTQKYASEKERNITIKLGYANAKIYKCLKCPKPNCYQSGQSETMSLNCKYCHEPMELKKHISLVDSPGHQSLMATMLNGTSVMDCTILVESVANKGAASQTNEHISATNLINLPNKIVCMNKMDLVKKDVALERIQILQKYLQDINITKNSPIVPVAANYGINIDILCQYICELMPEPTRDLDGTLKMIVVRSFNVNKQEIDVNDLQGGVVGGTIIRGKLSLDDYVTVYPGYVKVSDTKKTKWTYKPLRTKVLSIHSEKNSLAFAIPGGLIGIKLDIDPGFTVKDGLVGNLVSINNSDTLQVYDTLFVEFKVFERTDNAACVLKTDDILVINCNSNNTKGSIVKIRNNKMEISLQENPLCLEIGDYITISKMIDRNITVIGRGKVLDGILSELQE